MGTDSFYLDRACCVDVFVLLSTVLTLVGCSGVADASFIVVEVSDQVPVGGELPRNS